MSKPQIRIKDKCNNCRFWLDKRLFSDGTWGVCGIISHDGHKPLVGPDDSIGATVGGRESNCHIPGKLHTRQDYGCTLSYQKIDYCLLCQTTLNDSWNYCPSCGEKR